MGCTVMGPGTENPMSLGLCACYPASREVFIASPPRIEIKGYIADCPASEDGHNARWRKGFERGWWGRDRAQVLRVTRVQQVVQDTPGVGSRLT